VLFAFDVFGFVSSTLC